jgi:hypothetical protein
MATGRIIADYNASEAELRPVLLKMIAVMAKKLPRENKLVDLAMKSDYGALNTLIFQHYTKEIIKDKVDIKITSLEEAKELAHKIYALLTHAVINRLIDKSAIAEHVYEIYQKANALYLRQIKPLFTPASLNEADQNNIREIHGIIAQELANANWFTANVRRSKEYTKVLQSFQKYSAKHSLTLSDHIEQFFQSSEREKSFLAHRHSLEAYASSYYFYEQYQAVGTLSIDEHLDCLTAIYEITAEWKKESDLLAGFEILNVEDQRFLAEGRDILYAKLRYISDTALNLYSTTTDSELRKKALGINTLTSNLAKSFQRPTSYYVLESGATPTPYFALDSGARLTIQTEIPVSYIPSITTLAIDSLTNMAKTALPFATLPHLLPMGEGTPSSIASESSNSNQYSTFAVMGIATIGLAATVGTFLWLRSCYRSYSDTTHTNTEQESKEEIPSSTHQRSRKKITRQEPEKQATEKMEMAKSIPIASPETQAAKRKVRMQTFNDAKISARSALDEIDNQCNRNPSLFKHWQLPNPLRKNLDEALLAEFSDENLIEFHRTLEILENRELLSDAKKAQKQSLKDKDKKRPGARQFEIHKAMQEAQANSVSQDVKSSEIRHEVKQKPSGPKKDIKPPSIRLFPPKSHTVPNRSELTESEQQEKCLNFAFSYLKQIDSICKNFHDNERKGSPITSLDNIKYFFGLFGAMERTSELLKQYIIYNENATPHLTEKALEDIRNVLHKHRIDRLRPLLVDVVMAAEAFLNLITHEFETHPDVIILTLKQKTNLRELKGNLEEKRDNTGKKLLIIPFHQIPLLSKLSATVPDSKISNDISPDYMIAVAKNLIPAIRKVHEEVKLLEDKRVMPPFAMTALKKMLTILGGFSDTKALRVMKQRANTNPELLKLYDLLTSKNGCRMICNQAGHAAVYVDTPKDTVLEIAEQAIDIHEHLLHCDTEISIYPSSPVEPTTTLRSYR